jgi:hypothetical protein
MPGFKKEKNGSDPMNGTAKNRPWAVLFSGTVE